MTFVTIRSFAILERKASLESSLRGCLAGPAFDVTRCRGRLETTWASRGILEADAFLLTQRADFAQFSAPISAKRAVGLDRRSVSTSTVCGRRLVKNRLSRLGARPPAARGSGSPLP